MIKKLLHLLPLTGPPDKKAQAGIFVLIFVMGVLLSTGMNRQGDPDTYAFAQANTPGVTETPAAMVTPTANLEIQENREQTNGIILGGVLLVIIIVGGTLSILRQEQKQSQQK